jgi:phosphatidate phosphatase APP1
MKTTIDGRIRKTVSLRFVYWLLASLVMTAPLMAVDSPIARDEEVVGFPTYAYREKEKWIVPIHGVIREIEPGSLKRRAMLSLVEKTIQVEKDSSAERLMQSRLRPFIADNERGKKLSLTLESKTHVLSASTADGVIKTSLELTDQDAKPLLELATKSAGWVDYRFVMPKGDSRQFGGRVLFLNDVGLSVISDIDDTVKDSHVLDRPELIANTFLREYRPIAGMPELYQRFENASIPIHYVSASPWQLYEPLQSFFATSKLPQGTFHMREFDLKRSSITAMFESTLNLKRQSIDPLLKRFPNRKFLLIGDSGEHDPEIYGKVASEFPTRIVGIWIRNVPGRTCDEARCQAAFRSDLWRVFDQPVELTKDAQRLVEQAVQK